MNILSFTLPDSLAATEPPERRGLARDQVRLVVLDRDGNTQHSQFNQLDKFLQPGDLLVFNASRTLPAVLKGQEVGTCQFIEVRLAHQQADGSWLALLLCDTSQALKPPAEDPTESNLFSCGLSTDMRIDFGQGLTATVEAQDKRIHRLWRLRFSLSGTDLVNKLHQIGQPVRYSYVSAPWDLDYYQTVYASVPGSAEMPSAGRAFTWELLFKLKQQGIETTNVVLHTGLSSYLDDALDAQHPASEEEYFISEDAAKKINRARQQGGRIIAVGTTVVRALESAVDERSQIVPGHNYTRLIITATHTLRAIDSLLTGLHEPEASHLDLLTAFLPPEKLQPAYEEAVRLGYLWHEFGDLNLIV